MRLNVANIRGVILPFFSRFCTEVSKGTGNWGGGGGESHGGGHKEEQGARKKFEPESTNRPNN